jgi:hypothetical protein
MATRNTISRITSRIDDLTERYTPSRVPIMIAVRDEAEYRAKLREIEDWRAVGAPGHLHPHQCAAEGLGR